MLTTPLSLRHAVRSLRRTLTFSIAAVAIVTTSVATGAIVFAIVDAVYFRPLPYVDAERLFLIEDPGAPPGCQATCPLPITTQNVRRLAAALSPFADVAYGHDTQLSFATDAATLLPDGAVVSPSFFRELGTRPALGRLIAPVDSGTPADPVVVLGHAFWQSTFGGDSSVIGRVVLLNDQPHRIVGVLAPEGSLGRPFFDPSEPTAPFFIPSDDPAASVGVEVGYTVIARLRPTVSREAFAARASTVLAQMIADSPVSKSRAKSGALRLRVVGLRTAFSRANASVYRLFLAAVIALVCVACTNLAALFLARLNARSVELALRAALGARRRQLVEQPLVEALLICGGGAAAGLALACLSLGLIRAFPTNAFPYWTDVALDWRVVTFAGAVAAFGAVLFGLFPAMLAARATSESMLRATGTGSEATVGRAFARRSLVAFQIAATLVLLSFAGSFTKALRAASSIDIGMSKATVAFGALDLTDMTDTAAMTRRELAARIVARLTEIPGVVAAATSGTVAGKVPNVLAHSTRNGAADVENVRLTINAISAGYFATLGAHIVSGREFTPADRSGTGESDLVAMLDEPTASQLFPGESAIGQRIKLGAATSAEPWRLVVGVVRAPQLYVLGATSRYRPTVYVPITQAPISVLRFAVKTRGNVDAVFADVRRAVHNVAPRLPLAGLESIDAVIDGQLAPLRTNSVVVGIFAVTALLLATFGVYGTVAYGIAQRRNEIAVRIALGAQYSDVLRFTFLDTVPLVVAAFVFGLGGTLAGTRVARAFLGSIGRWDASVIIGAVLLLAGCVGVAVFVPARRAARTDPTVALRT